MGTPNTITINSRTYPSGETVINAPQKIARQYESYEISLTRENWPPGVDFVASNGVTEHNIAVVIEYERSLDGGQTWVSAGSFWAPGGTVRDRFGNVITSSGARFSGIDPKTRQSKVETAQLRIRFIRLVPIDTTITVSVVEP